jgi:hypothetical protein
VQVIAAEVDNLSPQCGAFVFSTIIPFSNFVIHFHRIKRLAAIRAVLCFLVARGTPDVGKELFKPVRNICFVSGSLKHELLPNFRRRNRAN